MADRHDYTNYEYDRGRERRGGDYNQSYGGRESEYNRDRSDEGKRINRELSGVRKHFGWEREGMPNRDWYFQRDEDINREGGWNREAGWEREEPYRGRAEQERPFSGRQNFDRDRDWGNENPYGAGSRGFGTTWGYAGSPGGFGSYGGGTGGYGRYAGRGPKGYQRSDERIREDVCERLTRHPDVDASNIEVKVNSAEVTLTGTVEDRVFKRIAEDVAESVYGVRDVRNDLRVEHQGGAVESSLHRS